MAHDQGGRGTRGPRALGAPLLRAKGSSTRRGAGRAAPLPPRDAAAHRVRAGRPARRLDARRDPPGARRAPRRPHADAGRLGDAVALVATAPRRADRDARAPARPTDHRASAAAASPSRPARSTIPRTPPPPSVPARATCSATIRAPSRNRAAGGVAGRRPGDEGRPRGGGPPQRVDLRPWPGAAGRIPDDRSVHRTDTERLEGLHHARGARASPTRSTSSTSWRATRSSPST